jgi:hypothetical protein
MKTIKYLKEYEILIKDKLADKKANLDWQSLQNYHRAQIQFFQHERLIHLLVTLTYALATLIVFGLTLSFPNFGIVILNAILLIMLIFYVQHYFALENGVQRLYFLDQAIAQRIIEI